MTGTWFCQQGLLFKEGFRIWGLGFRHEGADLISIGFQGTVRICIQ